MSDNITYSATEDGTSITFKYVKNHDDSGTYEYKITREDKELDSGGGSTNICVSDLLLRILQKKSHAQRDQEKKPEAKNLIPGPQPGIVTRYGEISFTTSLDETPSGYIFTDKYKGVTFHRGFIEFRDIENDLDSVLSKKRRFSTSWNMEYRSLKKPKCETVLFTYGGIECISYVKKTKTGWRVSEYGENMKLIHSYVVNYNLSLLDVCDLGIMLKGYRNADWKKGWDSYLSSKGG